MIVSEGVGESCFEVEPANYVKVLAYRCGGDSATEEGSIAGDSGGHCRERRQAVGATEGEVFSQM